MKFALVTLFFATVATTATATAASETTTTRSTPTTTPEGGYSERYILQDFYQVTHGPSWNNNAGWEDNTDDICNWYGVICDGEEYQIDDNNDDNDNTRQLLEIDDIYRLNHRNQQQRNHRNQQQRNLQTKIPDYKNHGQVIGLKLKNNNLQGRIPATFWQLPNLRILHISQNAVDMAFTGESDTLIELKMHATTTSTLTGISRFPNLLSLHMSETSLGDVTFPMELLKLRQLRNLHMANCQLEGQVPERIFDLELLHELNLYDNEFTGLIPAGIEYLTDLRILTLSKNHFRGRLPEWLSTDLINMEQLYLEQNMMTGQLLPFNAAPNLWRLYLDGNALTESIPANFLEGIQEQEGRQIHVNLDNNQLGDIVPADTLDYLQDLPLKITMAGNLFKAFSSDALCDNINWMDDDDMSTYGCAAILCPVRTSATLGRHTDTSPCVRCDTGTHIGQMTCLDQDDRRTLQYLYAETGGDHWHRNDNWLDDSKSVCEWYGIKCYTENESHTGRVRRIRLPNNGLIGSISSHIYALGVMTEIDISWNKVWFPFQDISLSTTLHILNVGHTDTTSFDGLEEANSFFTVFLADHLEIDGTIPQQLYQNTNMEILSLNNCGLSGSISSKLGEMVNLKELYLWGNNLKGSIPAEIGQLPNLRIMSLAKNQLTGTLPESLENLNALEAFTIKDQVSKGGGLTGNLLPFQYNPLMSNLILSGNKFDGSIPDTLLDNVQVADVPGTLIVDLSNNQLTGSVPGSLAKFDQMDLFVESNFITAVNQRLCGKRDWMYGNVGEYGCDAILCPQYTASALGRQAFDNQECQSCDSPSNPSIGQTSCSVKNAVMTERQTLEILYKDCGGPEWTHQENWISTANFCEWYGIACDNAKSIVSIVLGANNMQGTIPRQVFLLPNLKRLSIFSNPVDFNFDGIENAGNLKSLVLDETRVTSIVGVGKARGLIELNVRANRLSGPLPDEIADLNSLESLVVSDNKFSGTLPLWLGKLNKLTTLMLSNNQFTGTLIPFQNYPHISLMGIAKNKLSGPIPYEFLQQAPKDGKIFCDISSNFLTGTIPESLARLNRLSLHSHNNHLVGIASKLCAQEAWNDYDVQTYGCNGILCPAGTYNDKGRQSSDDLPCESCPENKYFGSTQCSRTCGRWLSGLVMIGGLVAVIAASL